jgi:uncharacterized protein YbjT (DUF2867 family)
MRIFLTGASGFVGSRVLDDLLAAGHTVTALVHSRRSKEKLLSRHPDLPVILGDVSNSEKMIRDLPKGTETVIFLPGLLREVPSKGITFPAVHVEGVRNVLAAAKEAGVRRWIEISALGAAPSGSTKYFRTKYDAEELVRASGLAWTILRPSLIFDCRLRGEHNFVDEVAKAIRMAPFVPVLGSGSYILQPVSLDDVSEAILQSLTKPETIGKTYELGGPEQLTYREVVTTIARAMNSKKPAIRVPLWLIMSIARLMDRFSWFPITADEIEMLRNGNYVRNPAKEREARETFKLPMKRFLECVPLSLHK